MRLFGETYPVRAKVFTIGGLSAHADRRALLGWLAGFGRPSAQSWIVHGEPLAAFSLRDALLERPGCGRRSPTWRGCSSSDFCRPRAPELTQVKPQRRPCPKMAA